VSQLGSAVVGLRQKPLQGQERHVPWAHKLSSRSERAQS
jgi:hypothetical protein